MKNQKIMNQKEYEKHIASKDDRNLLLIWDLKRSSVKMNLLLKVTLNIFNTNKKNLVRILLFLI